MDVFRLDWIFIDTIIITLLLLSLIIVKIFKEKSRWRSSFSNEALECINYKTLDVKLKTLNVIVKNWSLIRNITLKGENHSKPTIIFVKTNNKRKLLYILTGGLAGYGFEVIIIDLKVKNDLINEEVKRLISNLLDFFKKKGLISNSNYILINYSNSNLSFKSILFDTNNRGIFLINPRLNSLNIRNFLDIFNYKDLKSQIFTIFSKKSNFIMLNKNLKKFLKKLPRQNNENLRLFILEKARKTFKYYETILLAILINILKKISLRSKI